MKIEYLGHACFRIYTDKGTVVITDPYTGVGYELPDGLTTDIVTVSHGHFDHNAVEKINGVKHVVDTVGTFVFDDVEIENFICNHDEKGGSLRGKNIVNTITVDGVKICHMGDVGEPCSAEILAKIGKVDVLLLPVGGTYTVDAVEAKRYVERIAPKIAIPMHYRPDDGKLDITDEKAFLSLFSSVEFAEKNTPISLAFTESTKILFMERTRV